MMSWKRSIISRLLLLTLVIGQVMLFAVPKQAHAQWAVTNPDIIALETQEQIKEIIQTQLKDALIAAVSTSLMNTMFYAVGNVAQRTAVWVASGGPGDQPLYSRESARDFGVNTGAVALMSLYDALNEEDLFRNTDIDIDIPDEAAFLLALRQGLYASYVEPDVDFDFTDYRDSYPAYLASVAASDMTAAEKTQAILGMSAMSFAHNEFGNGLKLYSEALVGAQQEAQSAVDGFHESGGFLDQVDATSGYRDLPAQFVRDQLYDDLRRAQDLPYSTFSNMFSGENVLVQLGVYGGQVFTGTLVSELMNRYYGGLFDGVAPTFSENPFDPNSTTSFSRERAQQLFQGFTAFRPLQVTDYHLVSELSSCASGRFDSIRPLFSCAMDTSFAAAVTRAETGASLTIEDAIDEGYLNGSWPLIPPTDTSRNQDDNCYTYGFCHSNLVKLRKARIISIGWELAAESDQNSAEDPITLQEVLDGFHECNADGERDEDHPWCHMIDPSWVLKAPETSCRTTAYGQLLEGSGIASRAQECVDLQTCISEDENGQCTGGYGYCVREENTWRFQGESCPEQYASCLSFEERDGDLVDYLTTTTDINECGEGEVGCQWYATTQAPGEDGEYDWPAVNDVDKALDGNDAHLRIAFFNAEAELCDASEAGCSEVLPRGTNVNLNIIPNASFERDEDENGWPDGWLSEDWTTVAYSIDDTYARSGDSAISTGADDFYRYGMALNQSRFYGLSFYARQESTGADSVTVKLTLSDVNQAEAVDLDGTSYTDGCTIEDLDGDGAFETVSVSLTPEGEDYERAECLFTAPTLTNQASKIDGRLLITGSSVYIDDIQIVQDEDISTFHVGYSATATPTYVQLAPDYLGCTGSDDDPSACDNYATICSANDVGCALYSPTNGDPDVSGVVSELDTCSESCVGYDTFKQEATRYEPNGEFPLYFIPDSADECNEEAVGCDEFTNLSTEENEYFTYLRACLTTDQADSNVGGDASAIFYTWEGSDETGYQLRTWSLLESDLDGVAYQNYSHAASGEVDVDPGAGPCTHWETDEDGITCHDDNDGDLVIDTDAEDCDEHDDILTNPDCREFYDVDGDIHYRLWSETVTVNDACVSYRKTDLAGLGDDTDGDGVDDGQANCTDAGGYFDAATNICRFYGYSAESTTCADKDAGCRAFTGGRSNNSRVAMTDLFENGTAANWEAANATNVGLSNESIATDGNSLKTTGETIWTYQYDEGAECTDEEGCDSGISVLGGSCTVREGQQYCGTLGDELFANKTYTLSFWAKGSGEVDIGFDIAAGSSPNVEVAFEEGLELTSDWKRYSLGPLDMNETDYPNFGNGTVLVFDPTSSTTLWIDNVVLREGEDELTLIKDSWVTPATCDINLEGNASPQYQLGCQEYLDSDGDEVYLKSFSTLCDEDKVGCKAYYETHESDNEYAQIYNGICGDLSGAAVTEAKDCYLLSDAVGTSYDTNSPLLCVIAAGAESCHFDLEDNAIPASYLASEVELAHISYGPETAITSTDSDLYAIVGAGDSCSSGGAGCTELGDPELAFDRTVVDAWESTYLINDPDDYGTIRCTNDEAWCEAFDAGSEGVYYFKDPGNSVCEYKTGITIDGEDYDGWFREGTSEFCYGTGSCSESGASCTTDAECRADSGTCSDTGAICSQDYDCNADAFCEGLSTETCEVNDPSFLKSGSFSGIWQNGDTEYLGYVGACDPEYDTCSAFEDPLAIDDDEFYGNDEVEGETFHFLNNDRLEESDILTSTSCKGQVSPKEGCVLFKDAADAGLDYNASASYIASVHADEFFGDEPFSLVSPIDCNDDRDRSLTTSDGTEIDLCAQRCVYEKANLSSRFTVRRTTAGGDIDDVYSFGSSCYVDADCADMESDSGDLIQGSCSSTVELTNIFGATVETDVPELENDANRVMSVSRDRVCSEWLACASSYTVWDEELGKYREVCDSINLCTNYSETGDSFCNEWDPDDPAVILDIERYTNRDVSWYGEEYSGYAIPDQFPVQHLSQVNVAPEQICQDASTGEYLDLVCDTDSDCTSAFGAAARCEAAPSDYRLVYDAGSCPDVGIGSEYGESCTIGYCSDDNSACTEDSQCNAGSCITGLCYDVSAESCSVDSDCSSGDICLSGFCASADADGAGCGLDFTCTDASQTCVASVATLEGTCLGDQCVVSPNGFAFNTDESENLACRAHPESDSPFGNNVVEEWIYVDQSGDGDISEPTEDTSNVPKIAQPFDTISGYENVNLCAFGEDCVCEYDTLTSSLGQEIHIDPDTSMTSLRDELANYYEDVYGGDLSGAELGICSGGSNNGQFCLIDGASRSEEYGCYAADTSDPDTAVATCNPITQGDTLVGLEGYCLERDTGINLEGDPTTGACLTWYPVDQLAGTTNLYAKATEAGYFADSYICSNTRPFMNLTISNRATSDNGVMACAESTTNCGNKGDSYTNMAECEANVVCPDNFYAIMGQCAETASVADGLYSDACYDGAGDADCPYVCVPEESYRYDEGTYSACGVPTEDDAAANQLDVFYDYGENSHGTHVYGVASKTYVNSHGTPTSTDYELWDEYVDSFEDCKVRAYEFDEDWYNDIVEFPCNDAGDLRGRTDCEDADDKDTGYYGLHTTAEIYPACEELIQVADSESYESYAWTDRIWSGTEEAYSISSSVAELNYERETEPTPFGVSATDPAEVNSEEPPIRVAACGVASAGSASTIFGAAFWISMALPDSDFSACSSGDEIDVDEEGFGNDPANPEARSYIDFDFTTAAWASPSDWTTNGEGKADVFGRVSQFFAKANFGNLFEWNDSDSEYDETADGSTTYTQTEADVRADEGTPPTIISLDVNNCYGPYCREGTEGRFTVNSTDSGDQSGEGGYFGANVKFYAAADKNQLPLRRVIVDWADDDDGLNISGSEDTDNFYKNRRGLQPDSQSTSYCDLGTEWGMTADSCDPNYFNFSHSYFCSESIIDDLDACTTDSDGNVTNSPCVATVDGEEVCAFRPRIHLRDNWGWCSGECSDGTFADEDGRGGCYAGDDYGLGDTATDVSECSYEYYPSFAGDSTDPWTYYDGNIYVSPN